jgi:NAD(P)-dependent dehydrogenase (short-subunit alcohol dehydrogenase family)
MTGRRTTALVVGAGSGIGQATARRLAARGVSVAIAGRREQPLRDLVHELRADHGVEACWYAGDAGDPDTAEAIVADAVETLGGIDGCVCATGVFVRVPYHRLDAASWREGLRNTLDPMVYVSAAAVRAMLGAGGGRVVLVSSVDAGASEPAAAPYNAAKAATSSLVRSMAVDLAHRNIQANAVAPGLVRTEMTAPTLATIEPERLSRANLLSRAGEADEIANVIAYLLLEAPEFLVGETIVVDGGLLVRIPTL